MASSSGIRSCFTGIGEDVHYVRANGTEKPERVKIRAPTLANLSSVSKMMEQNYLADVPIIIAAIDPCFSCTDRALVLKGFGKHSDRAMEWGELRSFGIEWYRKRGVDFSGANKRLSRIMEAH